MSKILLILKREYLTRVKKKSFIIMTILGPVLMATMVILPAFLADWSEATHKRVAVLDETGWFFEKFKDQDDVSFYYVIEDLQAEKEEALYKRGDLLLYIPKTELTVPESAELFSTSQPGLNVTAYIKSVMKEEVENKKLLARNIDPEVLKSAKAEIKLATIKVEQDGVEKKSNTEVEVGLAIFGGIMIYFFIFLFGAQVLKGIMEEKSNRIVEVIISSVKPFQLMMGKIIGIAMVGLTQFLLWIVLTGVFLGVFQSGVFGNDTKPGLQMMNQQSQMMQQNIETVETAGVDQFALISEILDSINFQVMIFSFIFYFLGGYLLYSSLFAAIGGAVDHDADTQQFMLPVSIPLIFSVMMSGVIVNQPDSTLSIWMSMIPFTAPVSMMMRIPFGVPYWQLALSMSLLVIGFVITTWMAGKIYKTGILMYGQKVTYLTMWKWLRNK
jgi:ABC-2 type transport system permease protein